MRAYRDFEMMVERYYHLRQELPVFTAATLLIPGYVDAAEARSIAGFRTELDTGISLASFVRARALGIKGMDEFMRRAE